jgi:hypothetical protein
MGCEVTDDPKSRRLARAAEIVAIRWADIDFTADPVEGGALYVVPNSKTNQQSEDTQLYLAARAVHHQQAWQAYRFPETP